MFKLGSLTLGLVMAQQAAWAVPSAFTSKCGDLRIENHTPATLLRDHEECDTVWVLPPDSGTIKVSSQVVSSANLGFCSTMKGVQGYSRRIASRIAKYSGEIDRMQPDIREAQEKFRESKAAYVELSQSEHSQKMNDLSELILDIDTRIEKVLKDMESCTQSCDVLRTEYKDLRADRRKARKDLREYRSKHSSIARAMDRARSRMEADELFLNQLEEEIGKKVSKQNRLAEQLLDLYSHYGKLEGGFVNVAYDSGWDNAIKELGELYSYDFKKVRTKNARIFGNLLGAREEDAYLNSLPAILDFSLGGFKNTPFGTTTGSHELSALPSRSQGSLRLSVAGACPVFYENFLEDGNRRLRLREDFTNLGFKFGISSTYEYAAAFKMKMKASYNLYKMYERLVTSGSKRRFFSSKSWTKVLERSEDRDTFHIKWDVEDPDSHYDAKTRDQITMAIKKQLYERAMIHMGKPLYEGTNPNTFHAPLPPTPGAVVFAKGLNETCGLFNIWCKGGSFVLMGLASSFGTSQASNNFKKEHNALIEETWDHDIAKLRAGVTSYSFLSEED